MTCSELMGAARGRRVRIASSKYRRISAGSVTTVLLPVPHEQDIRGVELGDGVDVGCGERLSPPLQDRESLLPRTCKGRRRQ
jgi:hypothetical protein